MITQNKFFRFLRLREELSILLYAPFNNTLYENVLQEYNAGTNFSEHNLIGKDLKAEIANTDAGAIPLL